MLISVNQKMKMKQLKKLKEERVGSVGKDIGVAVGRGESGRC